MKRTLKNLLFICTGNGGRSPMAKLLLEDLAKRHADPRIRQLIVDSAGTCPGKSVDEHLLSALHQLGISAVPDKPKDVTRERIVWADLVLTMTEVHKRQVLELCPGASSKVYTFREYVGEKGDIQDPAGQEVEVLVKTGWELRRLIRRLFEKLECDEGMVV